MACEGILITGVTDVLRKLVTVISQEIGLAWGVKDELKKLQRTIEMILAVVADAERRQVTEEAVKLWLRRLKDIAYDADDLMDEFSYENIRRCEQGVNFKLKVLDFVSSTNPLAIRFKLARKIKGINSKLDEVAKEMDRFQLKLIPRSTSVAQGESNERRSRETSSFACQSQIVGREDDKNKLVKMLTTVTASSSASLSNTDHLDKVSAISIVGMGGLGKTTLAQLVYNDDSVSQLFEPKIWVCVSDNFDVYRLLSDIMESITREKFSDLSNFDVLVRKVREQLTGKRYLLVLDDLWNEDAEQWERLRSSLIVGAQGSKILLTTRKRQVAEVVGGSVSPFFLEKLRVDECWSIMERKAFSPGGALKTPKMTTIGKQIANKCSGLPLAAKFLGSLMHSKNKESNWISIRENDMWNTHESQSKIIPILKLSYDNLSPHLQRCFSYCSIFPKGWVLSKQILIQLWMAEGFLQPSNIGNDCLFEDIGDEYFESLMWSSFFDGVEKNELDEVMTFKMHDLVHDLAQAVVGDHECATVKVTDQLETISEVRRLNLMVDKQSSESKSVSTIKKLRTIIVPEVNDSLNLHRFSSKNHLRILYLGHPRNSCLWIRRFGTIMSEFRHLRYFHVCSSNLSSVPLGSLSKLYYLQTLVLRKCSFVQNFVKEMGSLQHLRHLDISFTDIQVLPDSVTSLHNLQRLDLNHCVDFTTFPDSVTGMEHLRFLDMSFTSIEEVPDFVTRLQNLQTLDVNTCKRLKRLPEYVVGLQNLNIFNFKECPLLDVLPKDFGALTQLRYLNFGGTRIKVFPESCANLNNLEYVDLGWCELPKEVTSWIKLRFLHYSHKGTPMGIGKLVKLQALSYHVREKVIDDPECYDGIEELASLTSLEALAIMNLQNVKELMDAERSDLKGKQNLFYLALCWYALEEDAGILKCQTRSCDLKLFEALQPPTGLRHLVIYNFMGRDLPTWMRVPLGILPNLNKLELHNCKGISQLPAAIGQLPRLMSLTLTGISLKSLDIDGFPSLFHLCLADMFLLEELCYSYPGLQILHIFGCRSLSRIPRFPSLKLLILEKINIKLLSLIVRSHTSLMTLLLSNIEELIFFPVSIRLCNLQNLVIKDCSHFRGFRVIADENENKFSPKFHLCSLRALSFIGCPVLKFLPDLRRWTSLQDLIIVNCPQVKKYLTYDLKSLSFLRTLFVDFIQRDEQRGNLSTTKDYIDWLKRCQYK